MRTKQLLLMLLLAFVGGMSRVNAQESVMIDGVRYELYEQDGEHRASVVKLTEGEYTGKITIPATVKYNNQSYNVTKIESYAFDKCKSLNEVIIPDGIDTIGIWAFAESTIKDIVLPTTLKSLGANAFRECTNITSVKIPENLAVIDMYTFENCTNLTDIYIPDGITHIYTHAFGNCKNLQNIKLPNSLQGLDMGAFIDTKIESIYIPQNVKYIWSSLYGIEYDHFYEDGNGLAVKERIDHLKSIVVDKNNSTYDSRDNCNAIISKEDNTLVCGCINTTIPSSVKKIGMNAFSQFNSPENVVLPEGLETIERSTFWACTNLRTVTLPESVTTIKNTAFAWCVNLQEITIHENVTNVGGCAFAETKLSKVMWNAISASTEQCSDDFSTNTIIFGDEVKDIPAYLLEYNLDTIERIIIPKSAETIGERALGNVKVVEYLNPTPIKLSSAIVNHPEQTILIVPRKAIEAYRRAEYWQDFGTIVDGEIQEGVKYNVDDATKTASVIGLETNEITTATIKDTIEVDNIKYPVTAIADSAFYDCRSLTHVTIPNSVQDIGEYAFYACYNLEDITIPEGIKVIKKYAFSNCSKLRELTIPNSVEVIDTCAFQFLKSVERINIGSGLKSIKRHGFFALIDESRHLDVYIDSFQHWLEIEFEDVYANPLQSSYINRADEEYTTVVHLFANGEEIHGKVEIPEGVKEIKANSFPRFVGMTELVIPNTAETIGERAFMGSANIEKITMGNNVKFIGANAFASCDSIKNIYCYAAKVPEVVEDNASNSFRNVPREAILWVPQDMIEQYKNAKVWGEFDVRAMNAETTQTEEVEIETTTYSATVTWPTVENANTYELSITDKQGNTVSTHIFNAEGRLQSIAFKAPSSNGKHNAPQQTDDVQTTGFRFTVTGLDENTKYDYTIKAKDVSDKVIETYTGEFATDSNIYADMENVEGEIFKVQSSKVQKVIENGHVYILTPDGKKYTVTGAEVK